MGGHRRVLQGWLVRYPALTAQLGLLLVAMLLGQLAYLPRFGLRAGLADEPTNIRIVGAYPVEGVAENAQRWTSPRATLRLAGVGAGPYTLLLRFHGGAQAGGGRLLAIAGHGGLALQALIRPDWQELRLLVPAAAVDPLSGDLTLTIDSTPIAGYFVA
jgi:hypothetical protein